jgi:hypothetical protein
LKWLNSAGSKARKEPSLLPRIGIDEKAFAKGQSFVSLILQSDPKFAGHSTIKIATKDQPAHVLLYKPEQESVLPYLVAYQCEFALRTIQADPNKQFNLSSRPNMLSDVLGLMDKHHKGKDDIPSHVIPQLANRLVMVLDSNSDPCQSRCVSTN